MYALEIKVVLTKQECALCNNIAELAGTTVEAVAYRFLKKAIQDRIIGL